MLLCSNAGGKKWMDPMVLRDGAGEYISADKFMHLPPTWMLYTTDSAYNCMDANEKWMERFIIVSGACKEKPQLLFWDAHDSHMGGRMMDIARKGHVYIIFLRSNASIIDQPNDNGLNARYKSAYDKAYQEYRQSHSPPCKISRAQMNLIIAAAWKKVTEDPTTPEVIVRAFDKCGIYPFEAL